MGRKSQAERSAEWRERCVRFSRASMTVAEFCRREEVSPAAFYRWRRRLAKRAEPSEKGTAEAAAAFVELGWGAAAVVELELPNGVRVRVPAEREAAVAAAIRAAGELAEPRAAAGEESAAC